jgi:anti-sigma B factor antagonist
VSDRTSVALTTARHRGPHVTLAGEVDATGAVRLRALLDDEIGPGVHLSLDLARVTHLSAPALAVLVHAYRRLRDGGGALVLTGASPAVVRVLRVSGLHRVLTLVPPAPRRSALPPAPLPPAPLPRTVWS